MTSRFLIEVPHEEEVTACARAVEFFLKTGSHFLNHTDWGCKDGVHKAWIIVEVDSKEDARNIVRPSRSIIAAVAARDVEGCRRSPRW